MQTAILSLKRKAVFFSIDTPHLQSFIQKALRWADHSFSQFSYLNPNRYELPFGTFPHMLAASALDKIKGSELSDNFSLLKYFYNEKKDWLFGYLSYDLKNDTENLKSENPDRIEMPLLYFFQPAHILFFKENGVEIQSVEDPELIYNLILLQPDTREENIGNIRITHNVSKETYIRNVEQIRKQIVEGDFYEMNYCMEFFAENVYLDPVYLYEKLNHLSPAPFSTLTKAGGKYLISASPERFLKKQGSKLTSQPIKGTARRETSQSEDMQRKVELLNSEKEKAENMMIVDLVRNDLARSSVPGTVKVEELFGIYSFPQVHQMVSTVSSTIRPEVHFIDAIKNAFPMGSMTGAPKIKVMETIEHLEQSRRGLYSGATGFITPEGDFDFNVVIRSILYNKKKQTLSFHTGSAITYDSNPEMEYNECILKAEAMMKILNSL